MTENLCEKIKILGFNCDGGLAEWVLVPESSLVSVPLNLEDDVACLAEPLACALNALDQCKVFAGDSVAIFGGGPVGLLMALAVKALGASPFIVETSSERIDQSVSFRNHLNIQAGLTIDSSSFDVAINACSSHQAFFSGISGLRAGGCFCFFSGFPAEETFSASMLNEIHYRQLRVVGAYGCTKAQIERSLFILEEFQPTAELIIQEEIPIEKTEAGLNKILEGQALKIVVNMNC
jgi:threonine dehydrogenase-like Zn-dependent dehydrogenase